MSNKKDKGKFPDEQDDTNHTKDDNDKPKHTRRQDEEN